MPLADLWPAEKNRFLENCTQCGLCAKECPVLPHTDSGRISSREIQRGVYDFLAEKTPNNPAYTKAFACMECFRCVLDVCPEGLNPMMINELIKGDYFSRGLAHHDLEDPDRPGGTHRVLASVLTSPAEFERISRPGPKSRAEFVFFPGCNVYRQPDKILNALDLMDAVGDDYAFLPGLDNCCGDSGFFVGAVEEGARKARGLIKALAEFEPEAVVLWCPTCHCRFETTFAPAYDPPFKVMSFAQYLAGRLDRLELSEAAAGTTTLHEACKSGFTGTDPDGPRDVLRGLPGVELLEMERRGRKASCCGSGAVCWFPESFKAVRDSRLAEAAATGAARLATVCHYCHQTFLGRADRYGLEVVNYVDLAARAIGIRRESRFEAFRRFPNLERILAASEESIEASPYEREQVAEVLARVFGT